MTQPKSIDELFRQLHAAYEPLRLALEDAATTMIQGFARWAETPEGQQTLEYARYLNEHPEEMERIRAAQRVETCSCLCQRWNHLGDCTGAATTSRAMTGLGYPHDVPMCAPCATSIDAQR
jgi:hypothetical protein